MSIHPMEAMQDFYVKKFTKETAESMTGMSLPFRL
jgi:hypothetical protein